LHGGKCEASSILAAAKGYKVQVIVMKCDICTHYENKCQLTECIYQYIPQRELLKKGRHISKGIWEYNGKVYKAIDFNVNMNCFICMALKL
jgi:hypothetical protein